MNLDQFKDLVSHMCLDGTLVASWCRFEPFDVNVIKISNFVVFAENSNASFGTQRNKRCDVLCCGR